MAFECRETILRARRLRKNMSLPEVLLWRELRASGLKFRRQHPIGDWVLDFYCASARTAIEIDGIAHDRGHQPSVDEKKASYLASKGISVLRLGAKEVLSDPAELAQAIVRACKA